MVYYNVRGYNSDMFLVGIVSWWYKGGLLDRIRIVNNRLKYLIDLFSIGLLVSTLFSPFRQISAEVTGNSLNDKLRALFDKILSRIIGAVVRTLMIAVGSIAMLIQIVLGGIMLLVWLTIPLIPVAGLILAVIGWVPK